MKSSIIATLVAMLVCLAATASAGLYCPPGITCIDVMDGGDGEVWGDDNFVTANSLDDYTNDGIKATITNGFDAKIKIPEGSQGIVNACYSKAESQSTNPYLNGEQYTLATCFSGKFKLGAEKKSDEGVEVAHAKILAQASADNGFASPDTCPTCKKNYMSGVATITADTKSTGTGSTYAVIEPQKDYQWGSWPGIYSNEKAEASYKVDHTCPTCPTIDKEISGEVKAKKVELSTFNCECPEGNCEPSAPTGTKIGTATITTTSNANNFKSASTSDISLDVSATRGKKGVSSIYGDICYASAASKARDGSAPVGTPNWNAQTQVKVDDLDAWAAGFAAGDNAKANGLLHSEATNNQDTQTNSAINKAEVYSAVVRTNLNNPYTTTNAGVDFDCAYFAADGRNLKSSNKYTFEYATITDLQASGQLQKVSNIWNKATLTLTAKRNGGNSLATITNDVSNYGPKTGFSGDKSEVHELIYNQVAEAKSPSETRFVRINTKDVDSLIKGTTGTPSSPDNQATISGITTSASGVTTANAAVTTQKVGVNNIWKLTFLESND